MDNIKVGDRVVALPLVKRGFSCCSGVVYDRWERQLNPRNNSIFIKFDDDENRAYHESEVILESRFIRDNKIENILGND